MKKIARSGINFHNLYIPIFYFKPHRNKKYRCPNAEKFYKDLITYHFL